MEQEIGTCDEGGSRSCPATENSPGILYLIDQLKKLSWYTIARVSEEAFVFGDIIIDDVIAIKSEPHF